MNLAQADRRPKPGSGAHPVDFNHPGFDALFDYWQSMREGSAIPRSTDFELVALAAWLPEIVILEVHALDRVITRFSGTGIAERLGIDPTGLNLLDLQSKSMLDRAARAYHAMANIPCGGMARFVSVYSSGREAIARSLYLPLTAPAGEPPRLVSMSTREDGGSIHGEPVERTVTGTQILSIDWFDFGFGVPAGF